MKCPMAMLQPDAAMRWDNAMRECDARIDSRSDLTYIACSVFSRGDITYIVCSFTLLTYIVVRSNATMISAYEFSLINALMRLWAVLKLLGRRTISRALLSADDVSHITYNAGT